MTPNPTEVTTMKNPCICGSWNHKSHPTETPENQQHTPTPWKVAEPIHDSKNGYTWAVAIFSDIAKSGDKLPAEAIASDRATAQANAAFIVRAVNVHEELLDLLKSLEDEFQVWVSSDDVRHPVWAQRRLERIRRILIRASGDGR